MLLCRCFPSFLLDTCIVFHVRTKTRTIVLVIFMSLLPVGTAHCGRINVHGVSHAGVVAICHLLYATIYEICPYFAWGAHIVTWPSTTWQRLLFITLGGACS